MEPIVFANFALIWLVLLINVVLTLALIRRVGTTPSGAGSALEVGQQAPEFAAETLTGEVVTLKTYAQRAVAFVFISTHCKPCREAIPLIEAILPQAKRAQANIVLVSTNSKSETEEFARELNTELPILIAPPASNPFMQDYRVVGTPVFCLVNEHGQVQSSGIPNSESPEWKNLLKMWDKRKPQYGL